LASFLNKLYLLEATYRGDSKG